MTTFARPGEASTGGLAEVIPGEHEERIPALDAATVAALEPRALRAQGCRAVTFGQPVSLGADAEFDIRFVRFLREAMSSLLTVGWSLAAPYPGDVSDISHLPPPAAPEAADAGAAADQARNWREQYGFGHCYYRLGPEFVHIIDVRDVDDAARFLLDEPPAAEAFLLLAGAVRLSEVPPLAAELAAQLSDARLLAVSGDWATVLAARLERWPLPCTAV
jgi:hypothetical protein